MNQNPVAESPTALRVLLLSLACLSGPAWAQSAPDQPPPLDDTWRFSLGLGVMSGPSYTGSDRSKTRALPLLGASYGRWTIGGGPEAGGEGLGVGAMLHRDRHWQFGAGLGLGLGKSREESDDGRLLGLGDIEGTTRANIFGRYGDGWFSARANLSTDIGGNRQGTQAGLDIEGCLRPWPGVTLSAGPGLRLGDQRYTQTFFGINAAQSAASGRAAYSPGAGLTDVHFSVGANYQLTPQLGLGLRLTTSQLRGGAADSPLTFDKTPNSVALFGVYRF